MAADDMHPFAASLRTMPVGPPRDRHGDIVVAERGHAAAPRAHDDAAAFDATMMQGTPGSAQGSGVKMIDALEQVVIARHCVREYAPQDVDDALLARALNLAKLAPSAGNLQAFEVVVVRDAAARAQIARAAVHQSFVATAPVVLVWAAHAVRSATKYGQRGRDLYCVQDATIAASYAQLALTALGLSSCWVGAFHEEAVSRIIGDKYAELRPVALLPVGYPAQLPRRHHRRSLDDFVHWEGSFSP